MKIATKEPVGKIRSLIRHQNQGALGRSNRLIQQGDGENLPRSVKESEEKHQDKRPQARHVAVGEIPVKSRRCLAISWVDIILEGYHRRRKSDRHERCGQAEEGITALISDAPQVGDRLKNASRYGLCHELGAFRAYKLDEVGLGLGG